MISAKLIKYLEEKGFELEFPSYEPEEAIIKILKSNNERLELAIPLLLMEEINIDYLLKKLSKEEKNKLKEIIQITKIIEKENKLNILNDDLRKISIKKSKKELKTRKEYFEQHLLGFLKNKEQIEKNELERSISIRKQPNIITDLKILFSPKKIEIMEKIFNIKPLTKTELEYYYRSIAPILKALMNQNLKDYAEIILKTKKQREK